MAAALGAVAKTLSKETGAATALFSYYFVPVSAKNAGRAGLRKWRIHWRPSLQVMWKYAKVELAPPTPGQLMQVPAQIQRMFTKDLQKIGDATTRDVCKNLFVALDIVLCFFVGEIIGKQKLVGYDIGNTSGHHPLAQKYVKHLWLPTEQEYEDLKRKGLV